MKTHVNMTTMSGSDQLTFTADRDELESGDGFKTSRGPACVLPSGVRSSQNASHSAAENMLPVWGKIRREKTWSQAWDSSSATCGERTAGSVSSVPASRTVCKLRDKDGNRNGMLALQAGMAAFIPGQDLVAFLKHALRGKPRRHQEGRRRRRR